MQIMHLITYNVSLILTSLVQSGMCNAGFFTYLPFIFIYIFVTVIMQIISMVMFIDITIDTIQ